jgi:hypothetical protein
MWQQSLHRANMPAASHGVVDDLRQFMLECPSYDGIRASYDLLPVDRSNFHEKRFETPKGISPLAGPCGGAGLSPSPQGGACQVVPPSCRTV